MPNLAECFRANLEVRTATTEEQKKDAYRVRYDVYCVERGYEDQTKFPERMERDKFDRESVHVVVRHRTSKCPVGVIRLVLPNRENPDRQFPIEKHFGHQFEKEVLKNFKFSRNNIVEISRFAVSRQALKHLQGQPAGETHHKYYDMRQNDFAQLLPQVSLGLLGKALIISEELGYEYWYAAMEPSLSRLLTRLGMKFTPIGPIMDYHGRRLPTIAKVSDMLKNIQHSRKDFFKLITEIGGIRTFEQQIPMLNQQTEQIASNSQ